MALNIIKGYQQLVAEAEKEIETISVDDALKLHGSAEVVFVDLRDVRELSREGFIPGAFHCPRGMLEFWIDPESPYYRAEFDTASELILYCNKGWRSALAALSLKSMGIEGVAHIAGGMERWQADIGRIEQIPAKS